MSLLLARVEIIDLFIVLCLDNCWFLHLSQRLLFRFLLIFSCFSSQLAILFCPFPLSVHSSLHNRSFFSLETLKVGEGQIYGQSGQVFEKLVGRLLSYRLLYFWIYNSPQGCFLRGSSSVFRVQKAEKEDVFGVVAAVGENLRMLKVRVDY